MSTNTEPQWYIDFTSAQLREQVKQFSDNDFSIDFWIKPEDAQKDGSLIYGLTSNQWLSCQDTDWLTIDPSSQQTFDFSCNTSENMLSVSSIAPASTTVSDTFLDTSGTISFNCNAAYNPWAVSSYHFMGNESKLIVKINSDGTVELGEQANMDDAVSALYWEAMKSFGQSTVFDRPASEVLHQLRNILGVPEGRSIIEYAKMLMEDMGSRAVVSEDPVQVADTDPAAAYERAMKVV